jgi:hypothetical protein
MEQGEGEEVVLPTHHRRLPFLNQSRQVEAVPLGSPEERVQRGQVVMAEGEQQGFLPLVHPLEMLPNQHQLATLAYKYHWSTKGSTYRHY